MWVHSDIEGPTIMNELVVLQVGHLAGLLFSSVGYYKESPPFSWAPLHVT